MKLIILGVVIVLKALLCKGLALGIFLLLFWIKGKNLDFNSKKWDDFFLQMSPQMVQRYIIAIYLAAAGISSAASYVILEAVRFEYSLGIAVLLFAGGLALTSYKWYTKGKDYVLKRFQEIPKTILERRE